MPGLHDYKWLLERAYSQVPERAGVKKERFTYPTAKIVVSGRRTFIENFRQICDQLRRDPKLCLRFMLKELAAPGELREQYAVIQGEIKPKTIQAILSRFIKDYVICPICGAPDTELVKEKKVMYIQCLACGAKSPVKPF